MFSAQTFDFLIENRINNSKEWFHEHKYIYDEFVLKPLTELSSAMGDAIASIDERIVTIPKINKTISRIYRDTRFSRDKTLFRDSMWLSFKRDKKEFPHYPEFFVVLNPQMLIYGCGYYWIDPKTMEKIRELVIEDHPAYKKALKAYNKQSVFTIEGDGYKRTKFPEQSEEKRQWLDKKTICFSHYSTDFSLVFSKDLADRLCKDMVLMKDVYDFLILAENKARGIIT